MMAKALQRDSVSEILLTGRVQSRSQGLLILWKENLDNKARRIALTLDPRLGSVHSISQVILPVLIRAPRLYVFGAITIHT